MRLHLIVALMFLGIASIAVGQTTGTTAVQVNVGSEAAITITNGTTTLTEGGTAFSTFTGTTNFSYQMRTTQTSGSGSIVLKVTSDFSPTGGPSVANPPSAGDTLTYTCTAGTNGAGATYCSGSQTASTSSTTSVMTTGADKHSNPTDTGSVSWVLVNDPKYKTGSYSSTVTFTISAS